MFKILNLFFKTLVVLFVLFSLHGCGDDEADKGSGTQGDNQVAQEALDEETLKLIMKYGLHRAAAEGDLKAVQAFIKAGAPLEEFDSFYGQTPLMWAAKQGYHQIAEALLSAGVDPNKATETSKQTALYFAAYNNKVEAIKVLLKWKADPNLQSWKYDEETPLHVAAEEGHVEAVTTLLAAPNIDLTIVNADGKTAKEMAKDDTIRALFPSE